MQEQRYSEEIRRCVEAYKRLVVQSRRISQIYDQMRYHCSLVSGIPLQDLLKYWTREDVERYHDWARSCYSVAPKTFLRYITGETTNVNRH